MAKDDSERLRRMVDELRSEPRHELEWDHVETELMAKIARGAAPRHSGARRQKGLLPALLAAAVALVFVFWMVTELRTSPPIAETRPQTPVVSSDTAAPLRPVDGDTLTAGHTIRSGSDAVSVQHTGRATWTLDPNGEASILERGDRIVLSLARGSVLSDVVPGGAPGRFVVEAGEARISVEGTVFRVTRDGDAVLVEVRRGVVAVGSREGGPTTQLVAERAARFDLSGRLEAQSEAPPVPVHPPAPPPPSAKPDTRETPAAGPGLEMHAAADPKAFLEAVSGLVHTCFAENTPPRGGIRISAQTKMRIDVLPTGHVDAAEFQPPLAPAVEACVRERLRGLRLEPSADGARVEQSLMLTR